MSKDKDGLDEGLKEKLMELLGDALPPGAKIDGVHVVGIPRGGKGPDIRPATLAFLQGLLKGTVQPKFEIGDIVVLREWAAERYFKWPKAGDRCIVTQVLAVPYRSGDYGSAVAGRPQDIALAFVDSDGDLIEYLHDSRMFEKVGSIYDPVTTADGEKLATH